MPHYERKCAAAGVVAEESAEVGLHAVRRLRTAGEVAPNLGRIGKWEEFGKVRLRKRFEIH